MYQVVGDCNDGVTHIYKGKVVMKGVERYESFFHYNWVNKQGRWTTYNQQNLMMRHVCIQFLAMLVYRVLLQWENYWIEKILNMAEMLWNALK